MKKNNLAGSILFIVLSILVLAFLTGRYSDPKLVLGGWMSEGKFVILLPAFVIFLCSLIMILTTQKFQKLHSKVDLAERFLSKHLYLFFFFFFFLLFVILLIEFLGINLYVESFREIIPSGMLCKLIPDFGLIFVLLFFSLLKKGHRDWGNIRKKIRILPIIIFSSVFLVLAANFKSTGLSIAVNATYYDGAGAAIFAMQFYLAICIGLMIFFLFKGKKPNRSFEKYLDLAFAILLFGTAFFYWRSANLPTNYFMQYINTETLAPFSDSRVYDLNAQGFILGQGIGFGYPAQKPLYGFILGVLHLILGQDYLHIINAQVFILASIPVFLYFVSNQIFNRSVGISTALLAIFHEYNLICLSSTITQSSVKMLMTDSFAYLSILVIAFLTLKWIKSPESMWLAALTGIFLALGTLLRLQMAVFIAVYVVAYLVAYKPRSFKNPLTIFIICVALVLVPWAGRNLVRSGQFSIEQPEYVDFAFIPKTILGQAQVSPEEGSFNSNVQLAADQLKTLSVRSSSYLNNSLMSSLNQIPIEYTKIEALNSSINAEIPTYPFPYLNLSKKQQLFLAFNILILFIGILNAWYRSRWKGIFPLSLYLVYILIISFSGYSGWRFIQPVDWVILLYFSAGIIGFFEFLSGCEISQSDEQPVLNNKFVFKWKKAIPGLILALMVGLVMPIGELLVADYDRGQTGKDLLTQSTSLDSATKEKIINFSKDSRSIIETGKALYPLDFSSDQNIGKVYAGFNPYPKYYQKHVDISDNRIQSAIEKGKHILFLVLANETVKEVYLFNPDQSIILGKGENAIIVGCDRGEFIEAFWIQFDGATIIQKSEGVPDDCSL